MFNIFNPAAPGLQRSAPGLPGPRRWEDKVDRAYPGAQFGAYRTPEFPDSPTTPPYLEMTPSSIQLSQWKPAVIAQLYLSIETDGGTFTLEYDGQITGNLEWNSTGNDVQIALSSLSTLGNLSVTASDSQLPGQGIILYFSVEIDPAKLTVASDAALTSSNPDVIPRASITAYVNSIATLPGPMVRDAPYFTTYYYNVGNWTRREPLPCQLSSEGGTLETYTNIWVGRFFSNSFYYGMYLSEPFSTRKQSWESAPYYRNSSIIPQTTEYMILDASDSRLLNTPLISGGIPITITLGANNNSIFLMKRYDGPDYGLADNEIINVNGFPKKYLGFFPMWLPIWDIKNQRFPESDLSLHWQPFNADVLHGVTSPSWHIRMTSGILNDPQYDNPMVFIPRDFYTYAQRNGVYKEVRNGISFPYQPGRIPYPVDPNSTYDNSIPFPYYFPTADLQGNLLAGGQTYGYLNPSGDTEFVFSVLGGQFIHHTQNTIAQYPSIKVRQYYL